MNEMEQISFSDIVGNESAKKRIQRVLSFADSTKAEALARFGVSSQGGVLLYGPPGRIHCQCVHLLLSSLIA